MEEPKMYEELWLEGGRHREVYADAYVDSLQVQLTRYRAAMEQAVEALEIGAIGMNDVNEFMTIFHEKLGRTGSFDQAFTKAVWKAWLAGYEAGSTTPEVLATPPKWAPKGE